MAGRILFLSLLLSLFSWSYAFDNQLNHIDEQKPFLAHENFIVVLTNGETHAYHQGVPGWNVSLGNLIQNGVATHLKREDARVFPGVDGSLYFAGAGREIPKKLEDIRVRNIVYESPITHMPAFPDTVFIGDKMNLVHQVLLGPDYAVHSVRGLDTNHSELLPGSSPISDSVLITFSQTRWRVSALDVAALQSRFDFEYSDILAFDRRMDEDAPTVRIIDNKVIVASVDDRPALTFGPFDEAIYGVYGLVPFSKDSTRLKGALCSEEFTLSLLARGTDVTLQGSANVPQLRDPEEELMFARVRRLYVHEGEIKYMHDVDDVPRLEFKELPFLTLVAELDQKYSWKDFALFCFTLVLLVGSCSSYIFFKQQKAEIPSLVQRYLESYLATTSSVSRMHSCESFPGLSDLVPPDSVLGKSLHNGRFMRDFSEHVTVGQGGFGIVYKANFTMEKSVYAVKMIPVELAANDEVNSCRDFREVFANLTLSDCGKNVVRYYTCWCEEPSFLPRTSWPERPCELSRNIERNDHEICRDPPYAEPPLRPLDVLSASMMPTESQRCSQRFVNRKFNSNDAMRSYLKVSEVSENTEPSIWDMSDDGFEWGARSDTGSTNASQSAPITLSDSSTPFTISRSDALVQGIPQGLESPKSSPASADHAGMKSVSQSFTPPEKHRVVVCIQMEYCDGRTLADFLRDLSARSKTDAGAKELDMCRQFIKGLKEIHGNNVVHRDLKPANVLVANNLIKIADFGLSVEIDSCTEETVGTPGYTPPEGAGTTAGDVYSAALILLELLHVPFQTCMERVNILDDFKRCGTIPSQIEKAVPEIADMLKKMIDIDPTQRPTATTVYHIFKRKCHAPDG